MNLAPGRSHQLFPGNGAAARRAYFTSLLALGRRPAKADENPGAGGRRYFVKRCRTLANARGSDALPSRDRQGAVAGECIFDPVGPGPLARESR